MYAGERERAATPLLLGLELNLTIHVFAHIHDHSRHGSRCPFCRNCSFRQRPGTKQPNFESPLRRLFFILLILMGARRDTKFRATCKSVRRKKGDKPLPCTGEKLAPFLLLRGTEDDDDKNGQALFNRLHDTVPKLRVRRSGEGLEQYVAFLATLVEDQSLLPWLRAGRAHGTRATTTLISSQACTDEDDEETEVRVAVIRTPECPRVRSGCTRCTCRGVVQSEAVQSADSTTTHAQ